MTPDQVAQQLGDTIAARRKELGATQEQLALLADVSVRFISSLESGKPTVRLDRLVVVLDALGLELQTPIRGLS